MTALEVRRRAVLRKLKEAAPGDGTLLGALANAQAMAMMLVTIAAAVRGDEYPSEQEFGAQIAVLLLDLGLPLEMPMCETISPRSVEPGRN